MNESPEEQRALESLDEETHDVGWGEEEKADAEGAIPGTGRWWLSRLFWPLGGSMLFRKRPLEPGLRDALRGKDDDKN